MASSRVPPPYSSNSIVDVDVTIVSAKHLKNVNWRRGDLKPYAVVYLAGFDADDHGRLVTKPDDAGSTRPVWNERFTLPVPSPLLDDCTLAVDVFHSKPSETPKPLVGTARCSLGDLIRSPYPIRTLELRRPSGRPQGKIRIKVSALEHAPPTSFHHTLPPPCWYHHLNALPPQPSPSVPPSCSSPRSTVRYPPAHSIPTQRLPPDQYGGYQSDPHFGSCPFGGYHVPAPLPWPFGGGPSAPVDQSSSSRQHRRGRDGGSRTEGSVAGMAVAGALGGLALDEREELSTPDYGGFRGEYR